MTVPSSLVVIWPKGEVSGVEIVWGGAGVYHRRLCPGCGVSIVRPCTTGWGE